MGPILITSPHTETHGPFFQIRPHSLGLGVSTSTLTFINFFLGGGNTIQPEHPPPGCRGLRGWRRGKSDPEEEERVSEIRTPERGWRGWQPPCPSSRLRLSLENSSGPALRGASRSCIQEACSRPGAPTSSFPCSWQERLELLFRENPQLWCGQLTG